ncbi:MAG: 2-C-methyl-D-erythritol 4-phosphate cytidylyltransferase [Oscillospiraceae bacterium]|nr:2-C-methyl-D-erythritol 4-phosphate cytidylyltransferase [Oscillospiraceae bacterium]
MTLFDLSAFVTNRIRCSAVIVAAGASTRFGSDKLFAPLNGIPVLAYSLTTFEACENISEIIVVTEPEKITKVAELCGRYNISKLTKVVSGGATRLESSLSGVSETDKKCELIAVHDGARPLVSVKIIEDAIKGAYKHRAAIPAVPARDTVKILSGAFTSETPDRATAWCAQTPQVFLPELVKGALTSALQKGIPASDDASAVEMLGFPVYITEGSEENIKITTPLDIKFAECILESRKERASV